MIDGTIDKVICGDCLEVMRDMPDNSVDTVITDPPAGIAFMGKSWDKDKGGRSQWIAWLAEIMAECLRVTKPGGSLLCWSIPRTSHWTGMAIEDGGWRVVDKICHLFGSGFPKSLDVSKALDEYHFRKWMKAHPDQAKKYQAELSKAKGSSKALEHVKRKYKRMAGAEREVVGKKPYTSSDIRGGNLMDSQDKTRLQRLETAPATPLAQLWDGYGSALKPAVEYWYLAYKPLDGGYTNNAEKWGVAGINVDGSRIGTEDKREASGKQSAKSITLQGGADGTLNVSVSSTHPQGRFPSNVILSCNCPQGSDGCHEPDCPVRIIDEQSGVRKSTIDKRNPNGKTDNNAFGDYNSQPGVISGHSDSGGASRFFKILNPDPCFLCGYVEEHGNLEVGPNVYLCDECLIQGEALDLPAQFRYCAKPSRAERNKGCEGMEEGEPPANARSKPAEGRRSALGLPRQNHHPTVKSVALMEYLCNLTRTPTGGIVLDPFAGSGSTGIAAYRTGRSYILIEQEQEFAEIARARIEAAKGQYTLFGEQ